MILYLKGGLIFVKKESRIKIIIVEPGRQPKAVEVDNQLYVFQKIVGGYIETLSLAPNNIIVCDEEGKLKGYPTNRYVGKYRDVICGTFFVTKSEDSEFVSFTQEEIDELLKLYDLNSGEYKAIFY